MKKKNVIMAIVQSEDPERYRTRTVEPEKGKGRKDRPRKKSWKIEDSGSFYLMM
jgi:stalled ribosome alternative rescue factor ArfA